MKSEHRRRPLVAALVASIAVTVLIAISGCTGKQNVADGGGMTLAEVEELSTEQQFDLVAERNVRMAELLTDAQLQVSDDVWYWAGGLAAPSSGLTAPYPIAGGTDENAYYLEMGRSIRMPGAVGAEEDTEPVVAYFTAQGWDVTIENTNGHYDIEADTGEGYTLEYQVQPNGQYNMTIFSRTFWGDRPAVSSAIAWRITEEQLEVQESVPGGFIPFPSWSDPVTEPDIFLDDLTEEGDED